MEIQNSFAHFVFSDSRENNAVNTENTSFLYSINNIIQESTSDYIRDYTDIQNNESLGEEISSPGTPPSSSSEAKEDFTDSCDAPQETSTVNSNDINLDLSIYDSDTNLIEIGQNPNSKSSKSEVLQKYFEIKRTKSAPLLVNKFDEFKNSSQYTNLEKAFVLANKLILAGREGKFDMESEEGGDICTQLLKQIEELMKSLNIKGYDRNYRKKFSQAYLYLFEDDSFCYLSEILDSAQEATPFLVVNGEKYTFSKEVLEFGNQLFSSFCALIVVLTESVKKIRDQFYYDNFIELKNEIKTALEDFDRKWTIYEEEYINELIEIEKHSRRYIVEGIKLEKKITQYETKANIKGKLLINDKEYNLLRKKFVDLINTLNSIANIEGKGRDDLRIEILAKAEEVLYTISDGKSKGMRNLAISIKESLMEMRNLFKDYETKVEGIDPQLKNNPELTNKLNEWEQRWEKGKEYLLNKEKFDQLLFFSEMIEIICDKYSHYSIHTLIEDSDPSIFVSIPSILLLKAIEGEDKKICVEYIPNLFNEKDESGRILKFIMEVKRDLMRKINDDFKVYNLLEKLILFNGTKEEETFEKEIKQYIDDKTIKELKKSLVNLSVHLQRDKPVEWNTFFELAMNIK